MNPLQIPTDLSLLGLVFAAILMILALSALALYVAFRIKETFKEEKTSRRAAKLALLLGVLFLSGGLFYFLATSLYQPTQPTQETVIETPTQPGQPSLTVTISYPGRTRIRGQVIVTMVFRNPTQYVAHDVIVQTNELFTLFRVVNSTHPLSGNVLFVGDVGSEPITVTIELTAPERPGQFSDQVQVSFAEIEDIISEEINIAIAGGGPP